MIKKPTVIHITLLAILSLVFSILAIPYFAHAYAFSRDLRLGMSGEDVRQLQIVLNADPATRVALLGAGSPGNESVYFGSLTRNAVIKFQEKYRYEILQPAGLLRGTGVAGKLTRVKLNALALSGIVVPKSPVSYPEMLELRLYEATPYQVRPGGTLTLKGDNFTPDAVFHIGASYTVPLIKNSDGSFETTIPATITEGSYEIWITSAKGSSRRESMPMQISVTSNPQPTPTISSVVPDKISALGQTVTVTGSNFTSKLSVVSVFGTIENIISQNGSTVTFTPSQFSNRIALEKVLETRPEGAGVSIPFFVVTSAGTASGTFIVQ